MGKTSSKVKDRWNQKNYDEFKIRVKKGDKEIIQAFAEQQGLSLNSYINQLIEHSMKGVNHETDHFEYRNIKQ